MPSEFSFRPEIDRSPFQVAGWRIDPSACRLARDGDEIHIEPKAMQVLVHLADRSGQVVSRQELEALVWTDTVVGYEAVTNAVIKLRKALGDDARHPRIIETIPKRGYRLIGEVTPAMTESQAPLRQSTPADESHDDEKAADSATEPGREGIPQSTVEAARATGRYPLPTTVVVALVVAIAGLLAWWHPWAPPVEPASLERMAYPLPDKPSIAVLPFDNLTGDPKQEYLNEGLSENIITELSRFKKFFVIARNSMFAYKKEEATVQQVAEELGVRYVVEGSVQTENERLRVTAQLIDATTGKHLWAERFDRELRDIFQVQDRITRTIAATLEENIDLAEYDRIRHKPTDSLTAYEYAKRALAQLLTVTRQGNEQAKRLYEKALALDPAYSNAYAGLAWVHMNSYHNSWSDSPSRPELLELALEMADKAIEHDPFNPKAQQALAHARMYSGDLDQAIKEYDRALELNPNSARVLAASSEPLIYLGRAQEAVSRMQTAIRLNPRHSDWYLWNLSFAQYCAEQYEDALATVKRMNNMPNGTRRILAAVLVRLDRFDEARAVIAEFHKNAPDYSLKAIKRLPFEHKQYQERLIEDLITAGLPEQ